MPAGSSNVSAAASLRMGVEAMCRPLILIALAGQLAACANTNPSVVFEPSKKSAVELRAAQARQIPGDTNSVMRGVIATLHDLGYRINRAAPDSGTVSATRNTALRMAVVVQPRSPELSIVRANATIVALHREAQVDSPEFYQQNFFEPLGAMLHREPVALPEDAAAPEAMHPTAERNTARERAAATGQPSPASDTATTQARD